MELNKLVEFMQQLIDAGMDRNDAIKNGYDFAVALYRSQEELASPRGTEISSSLQVQIMDHAADCLKIATGKVFTRHG